MHLSSRTVCSFGASLAWLAAMADATAGILEVDLVYPRSGQTYAPTPYMPVVFAIKHPHLVEHIEAQLRVRVLDPSEMEEAKMSVLSVNWANWTSSEPRFVYMFVDDFAKEGNWWFWFSLHYKACDVGRDGLFNGGTINGHTSTPLMMSTKVGGRGMDLPAATADEESCGIIAGHAIKVGDDLRNVTNPEKVDHSGTCVMLPDNTRTFPDSHFCDLKIDSDLAANITASFDRVVRGLQPAS